LVETFTLCVILQTYFQPNPRGETLRDAPAPFSQCKNCYCTQITRINIGDHPNHFRRYSRSASYLIRRLRHKLQAAQLAHPQGVSVRDRRFRKSHQAFPIMPPWSPSTHRFYFWNSIFSNQLNKCGMRRGPSYHAEKLALGRIAILLVETAILRNFCPLRMRPDVV
jgi:hypothetical protein